MTQDGKDGWLGRRIGNYSIVHRLGAGGMGVVYEAEQASLGRRIALKVLPRTPATQPMLIERFRREARLLSTLSHPNVVTVFDFGEESDLLYFAMELVPGGDLRSEMRRRGRLTAEETLPIVRDVAMALVVAHGKDIIHRDLKPENVMLVPVTGREPLAKVLDFGIARAVHDRSSALTGTGAIIGTPAYIAPEVMLGHENIDGRCDLYALGVIWFEMLTARPPFIGTSATALALQQVNESAPRVSRFAPGVPKSVDDAVAALLERDPDKRPKNAEVVLALLDDIEARVMQSAPTNPQPRGVISPFPGAEHDAPTMGATVAHFTLPTPLPGTHSGAAVVRPTPPRKTPVAVWVAGGGALALLVVALVAVALFRPPSTNATATTPATTANATTTATTATATTTATTAATAATATTAATTATATTAATTAAASTTTATVPPATTATTATTSTRSTTSSTATTAARTTTATTATTARASAAATTTSPSSTTAKAPLPLGTAREPQKTPAPTPAVTPAAAAPKPWAPDIIDDEKKPAPPPATKPDIIDG